MKVGPGSGDAGSEDGEYEGETGGSGVNVRAILGQDASHASQAVEGADPPQVGDDLEELRIPRARRSRVVHGVRLRRRALVAADTFALLGASALVGFAVASIHDGSFADALGVSLFFAVTLLPLWAGLTAISGLYRRDEQRADLTVTDDFVPVVVTATLGVWMIVVALSLGGVGVPTGVLVGLWVAAISLVLPARGIARSIVRRRPSYLQNTLIVGAGDVGQLLGRKLVQHPELGLRLIGFVDDDPKAMRRDLAEVPVLGKPDEIRMVVLRHDAQRVVVAFSNESHDRELELVHALRDLEVQIDVVPRLFEAIGPVGGLHYVEGLPLVTLPSIRPTRVARSAKRAIDVVGAMLGLLLLSPLFVVIAWNVKRGSPGPIFFRQQRLGQGMKTFELLKFRTMVVGTDEDPHREYVRSIMDTGEAPVDNDLYKLNRDDVVTKVGSRLRRTSLDELPQLINVLRGDMSLVGPRPCMPYERDLFEPHHFDRFLVPAGMTGLWQVTARARSTFKEALDLDAAYARDWSLGLDLKLIVRTPFVMFRARGTA